MIGANVPIFYATQEAKAMVMRNILHLPNNFIYCTFYENIILSSIINEHFIIDEITNGLDMEDCKVVKMSLTAYEINLRKRLFFNILS